MGCGSIFCCCFSNDYKIQENDIENENQSFMLQSSFRNKNSEEHLELISHDAHCVVIKSDNEKNITVNCDKNLKNSLNEAQQMQIQPNDLRDKITKQTITDETDCKK